MEFTHSVRFAGPVPAVLEALTSEAVADARAKKVGLDPENYSHEQKVDGDKVSSVSRLAIPAQMLPEAARAFIRRNVNARIFISSALAGETAEVPIRIEMDGVPLTVSAVLTLTPDGKETVGTYAGTLKVNIPFMGAAIENGAKPHVATLFDTDAEIINGLLAE